MKLVLSVASFIILLIGLLACMGGSFIFLMVLIKEGDNNTALFLGFCMLYFMIRASHEYDKLYSKLKEK